MESENKLSFIKQFTGIFYSPVEVYKDLVRFPRWILFFIVLAVIAIAFNLLVWQIPKSANALRELTYEKVKEAAKARNVEIPEDSIETQLKWTKWMGPVIAPVWLLLLALIVAGLTYLISYLFLDGKANFLMNFMVVLYSFAITIFHWVLNCLVMIIWGKADFLTSLIIFFPFLDEQNWIYPFLERLDLIYVWEMVVIGLGLKIINQWKTHKGIILTVSLYLAYVIIAGLFKFF